MVVWFKVKETKVTVPKNKVSKFFFHSERKNYKQITFE